MQCFRLGSQCMLPEIGWVSPSSVCYLVQKQSLNMELVISPFLSHCIMVAICSDEISSIVLLAKDEAVSQGEIFSWPQLGSPLLLSSGCAQVAGAVHPESVLGCSW